MSGPLNTATADTPQVLLEHHLKQLRLPTFLREYDKVARQCAAQRVDYPRYLLRLTEQELLDRERRATERRIHQARFPVPFFQLLAPLMPAKLAALEPDQPKTMAVVVKWDKRKMTLDGSSQLANGIFLRFEREFEGSVSYEDMAMRLKADEEEIFNMLGVQEEV
jgi:hypothetical protein